MTTGDGRLNGYLEGTRADRGRNLTGVGGVVTEYTGISIDRCYFDWEAMLMPGCELPTKMPLANVRTISEAPGEIGGGFFVKRLRFSLS